MKHNTDYSKTKAREATNEERNDFIDCCEWHLDGIDTSFFGLTNFQNWQSVIDTSREPELTVFDGFFSANSSLDGRLMVAVFPCIDGSGVIVRFGWRRIPNTSYLQCVHLGNSELEREMMA